MSRASKLSIRTKNMRVMANDLSIYIHWPFCLSKCPYCDFNSHIVSTIDYNQGLSLMKRKLSILSLLFKINI